MPIRIRLADVQIGYARRTLTGSSSASLQRSLRKPRLNRRSAPKEIARPSVKGVKNATNRRRFIHRTSQNPQPFAWSRGIGTKDISQVLAARNAPAMAHVTRSFGFGFRSSMAAIIARREGGLQFYCRAARVLLRIALRGRRSLRDLYTGFATGSRWSARDFHLL